jgi:hypothetical protein
MTQPFLTAEEILAWNDKTAQGWRQLLTSHPELLTQPCDIAETKTVAQLLQHIVAAQLRYAERLAGLPISDYDAIPFDSVESIYATHDRAIAIFQQLVASDINWHEPLEFTTRSRVLATLRPQNHPLPRAPARHPPLRTARKPRASVRRQTRLAHGLPLHAR